MSDSDNNQDRERFGRYLILDHLVDGGMAKICRARFLGEQADKIVAIKMVRPQYSQDESFKIMFMDEIKLTFGLIHPNIIQTYDYGIHNNQLFVAMEYCDGRNLKEYLDKLRERKFVFPVEISTYIITQVCQGLHYAHTFTDKLTGKESSIIHRDISPHNIMLTYDGAVKVIDFGIAKSDTNSESTQAGTIKGKLSYLAPEYLEGHELDPRYDEFAVGITLWEMLCSRKLFKANNDLAVLKKIQECKVPAPSSINPNVPKELDEIVLKALSKDRSKRYDDLDQLNRALMKFLYTHYPDFNSTDLSYFAKELFKEEIKKDREKLFEFGKIDLKPYLADLKREQSGGGAAAPAEQLEKTEAKAREREQVLDFGFEQDEEQAPEKIRVSQIRGDKAGANRAKPSAKPKRTPEDILGEGKEQELKIDISTQRQGQGGGQTSTAHNRDRGGRTGSDTKVRMKKTGSVTGTSVRKIKKSRADASESTSKLAGIVAACLLLFAGYVYFEHGDMVQEMLGLKPYEAPIVQEHQRPTPAENRRPAQTVEMGSFRLQGFDKYRQRVYLDGKEVEPDVIGVVRAQAGRDTVLRIQQAGRQHFVKMLRLEAGQELIIDVPQMPQAAFGYLETSRVCIRGEIHFEIYGEKRKEIVPIPQRGRIAFPTNRETDVTTHEVFFQRAGEDIQRKFVLQFREGRTTDLCDQIN
jgi:eukaryotic-like serine/threonine-protein kinase